ncbi:succinate dehydrogenase assembly factor 2 [Kushneria phosphatilytica]|uniref:FAD assembly factor SdhE n=1 Tax=Kushneria phosphatilytica TaxID=657387 RepID=A0A1S1NXK5_9GAMM|nr:succinate dehydrogenase assembly factor 2 [Kushneria phosphatilytica]OHV12198.1 succinate dehydrogenase assembly factor 2 [Kushneria phosphatilytica]QEL11390.1 succinate dehydrogenase assembly factor 2 [Kushneria phosphatilytica]
MDETARKRLYWHSRRGMWELDLMLMPFFEHCFDQLDADRQQAYTALLAEEDQDLFSWLMRRGRPMDASLATIVDEIIAYAERTRTAEVRPV